MQQVDRIDLAGMEVRAWVSGRKKMRCMKINQLLRLINGIVGEEKQQFRCYEEMGACCVGTQC